VTIPNVTIGWCRSKGKGGAIKCKWCELPIEIGTAMVRVFFWNKGNENSRKWNVQHCYHFQEDGPNCYVKQGLAYLEKNPYVPHARGIIHLLSEENKRKRFLLVRKFNELHQRKSNIKVEYPDNLPIEANLIERMVGVMMEVSGLGGVPKSWAGKIQ